jgi:hypothetical protein
MKSLKEKFGKFEMSKEQVKAVKGGYTGCNCNGELNYGFGTCPTGCTQFEVK